MKKNLKNLKFDSELIVGFLLAFGIVGICHVFELLVKLWFLKDKPQLVGRTTNKLKDKELNIICFLQSILIFSQKPMAVSSLLINKKIKKA